MATTNDFSLLMERVRAGCPQATRDLFERYGGHVRRIVRRRLNPRLRSQFDSLDFAQDVWASFFADPERFTFADPDALLGFLSSLAFHKVTDRVRQRLHTDKYDLTRERPDPEGQPTGVAGPTPTPSQVAVADEEWERMLAGWTPQQRQVLELRRQGHTYQEIADRLGLYPKAVQRFIQKLEERRAG